MAFYSAKSLGKRFSVAMLASGADFGAAADGVPGCVGPFDVRVEGQGVAVNRKAQIDVERRFLCPEMQGILEYLGRRLHAKLSENLHRYGV